MSRLCCQEMGIAGFALISRILDLYRLSTFIPCSLHSRRVLSCQSLAVWRLRHVNLWIARFCGDVVGSRLILDTNSSPYANYMLSGEILIMCITMLLQLLSTPADISEGVRALTFGLYSQISYSICRHSPGC